MKPPRHFLFNQIIWIADLTTDTWWIVSFNFGHFTIHLFGLLLYYKGWSHTLVRAGTNNCYYTRTVLTYFAVTLSCIKSMTLAFHLLNSIHVGSPNVTSLTYNDQSSTLTCTSTGGPATSVTWRRNGVVIAINDTYQQTKKLVDPVNGTYQTVLNIDPSVGQIVGTYTCTVENIRGESSETLVVPGETWTGASRLRNETKHDTKWKPGPQ